MLYHFPRPAQSCNTKTTQSQWSHQIHPEPNQDSHSGIFAMISDNQNSNVRYDYLGLVPDGFDETIEIELFSYYIFEQDEENDKATDTERDEQR